MDLIEAAAEIMAASGRQATRRGRLCDPPRQRRRRRPPQDEAGLTKTASLLWAGLHGLVSLRNDRPAFPWAPLQTLVSDLLEALLAPTPVASSPSRA